MWILKLFLALLIMAAIGLTAYAYLGDMDPDPKEMRNPVQLEGLSG